MRRTKSTLALLIVLVMLMTAFLPACGKKEDPVVTPPGTEQTTPGTTEETVKEKEEIEISIAIWDFVEFGNDPIGKKIADDLKIKIKCDPLSWDNDAEQVKLFGASGNMPDVIGTYPVGDSTRFFSWLDQGLLRTIPEELISKYPTVKSIFDADVVVNAVKDLRGEYTYIPRPESIKNYYIASHQVIYYRKDWMQNVGITKVPETIDEFYEMAKAFTLNDPDKNNKNDTYGITTAGLNMAWWGIWGQDTDAWLKDGDKFIPASFVPTPNIEALKFFRKIYSEGIYDPEFSQNGWKQAIQKFTTNTFGILGRNGDLHWLNKTIVGNWAAANTEVEDPLSVIGVLPPLKKDAGSQPGWPLFIGTCGSEIASHVTDEKLDRILELFEYLMQPDIKKMIAYGIEGEDYTMNGDKIERTIDPNTNEAVNINSKYPSAGGISCLTDWGWDNDIEDPNSTIAPDMKDLGKTVRDMFNPIAIKDNYVSIRYISTPTKETTEIGTRDAFTQIVMGKEDVEAMYNKFIQEAREKGMDTVIEEVNAKAKELGIK